MHVDAVAPARFDIIIDKHVRCPFSTAVAASLDAVFLRQNLNIHNFMTVRQEATFTLLPY